MQFIHKLVCSIKKKKQQQEVNIESPASDSNKKRFSSLRKLTTIKKRSIEQPPNDIHQELLLTQCIEVALHLQPEQVNYKRRTISFDGEYAYPIQRNRKLSLPPPNHYGQLESIPEVDSQIS